MSTDVEVYDYDKIPEEHKRQLVNVLHNPKLKAAGYHAKRTHRYAGRAVAKSAVGYYRSFGPLWDWLQARDKVELRKVALSEHNPAQANKAEEALTKTKRFRWGLASGLVLGVPFVAAGFDQDYLMADIPYGYWLTLSLGLVSFGQTIYGMRRGAPVKVLEEIGPREVGALDIRDINEFLVSVKVLKAPTDKMPNPPAAKWTRLPETIDGGQEMRFELPAGTGKSADYVLKKRNEMAAHAGVPLRQLELTKGKSEAELVLWKGDSDPYEREPSQHPVFSREVLRTNVFEGAVTGEDARGRMVRHRLFENNIMLAGIPGSGKSSVARAMMVTALLDPHVKFHVFDGGGAKDWQALKQVATTFHAGDIDEQAEALLRFLKHWTEVGSARRQKFAQMSDEECPDGKLTETLHRTGMPLEVLILEEMQEHLGHEKYGKEITKALVDGARLWRKSGQVIVCITQRPDSTLADLFTSLKAVISTKLACKVDSWKDADMVLGEIRDLGFDASKIDPSHQGACILKPGIGDTEHRGKVAVEFRGYWIDMPQWNALCADAKRMREELGEQPETVEPAQPSEAPEENSDNSDRPEPLKEEDRLFLCDVLEVLEDHGPLGSTALRDALELELSPEMMGKRLKKLGIEQQRSNSLSRHYLAETVRERLEQG